MSNDFANYDSIDRPDDDLPSGTRRLRVCLVETSVPGAKGSMPRYADLIQQAFEGDPEITIHRVSLARPPGVFRRLPSPLRTLAHHASVFFSAIKLNRRSGFDLFHVIDGSHGYVVPRLRSRPTTVTVHDVIPALQAAGRFDTAGPGRVSRWIINRAVDGVAKSIMLVVDSKSSLSDLASLRPEVCSKARVVFPPLEPKFFSPSSGRQVEPFVLHIGNNAFYKNRSGVIRVFAAIANRVPHRLVMAGPAPSEVLINLTKSLGVRERIEFLVDPSDDEVQGLYRDASLLLFPSVYEGFGWPPLEAMASGCPVVCSDAGSLAEVVGDAACVFAWNDVDSMADAAVNVLTDPALAARIKAMGLRHAGKFTLEAFRSDLRASWINVIAEAGVAKQGGISVSR